MQKIIFTVLAIISFLYYLRLGIYNGFGMSILPFWLILTILFILIGYRRELPILKKLPIGIQKAAGICLLAVLCFFLFVEGFVVWGMTRDGNENLDYLVVLGAALDGDQPSHVLEQRLECAYDYLEAHPRTRIVVSGGQGPTEKISEAESMKNWLVDRGIDASRILLEDNSTTTAENLRYSFSCIGKEKGNEELKVGIVTNNFHVFRSLCIANHVKEENAETAANYHTYGMAADFPGVLLPHYMVREFFTTIVDTLLGNMSYSF